ncbi:MAG TPA: GDP-L-fucose synthase [Candidatus Omnitrophota bacterium]|nr:GDP-L-fucose synthase [Candidatus Omnitrophota bacterium]HSA31397.1 GDP-L-fucose synthase [Candidatus Omnitrophota bacterium]
MQKTHRIYVAGHNGMVGSALVRRLKERGAKQLILRTHKELDLCDQRAVRDLFNKEKPEVVIVAAARVGGIKANMEHQAEFIRENLTIQTNVIHEAYLNGVERLCFLGSSCIYPRECPQPIKEEYLLTGPLEPTNEGYAIAKIAGMKMVDFYRRQYGLDWISVMPCNLYGTNDSFDLNTSHVISALVKKFVDAAYSHKDHVEVWGTGSARREFLHVDDAADGILFAMEHYHQDGHINLGSGRDVTIRELVEIVHEESGFAGKVVWDTSKPDGMPRKCMDISRIRELGWSPKIPLRDGVKKTVQEYRQLKNS